MHFKKKFELDEEPGVPEHFRWQVTKAVAHARHCSVVALGKSVSSGSKTRKTINGFKLTLSPGAARPKESVDDIAQAACNIMQWHWEQEAKKLEPGDPVPPIHFRVEFQCPDSPHTQRPYVPWTWDPDSMEDSFNDELRSIETTVLRELLDTTRQQMDSQYIFIGEMSDRFLKMAELNAEPIKQTGEQLNFANGLSLQGMNALVAAAQLTYSHEAQQALESQKTERWKMVMDKVGPGLQLAFGQLTAFVGNKITGKNVKIPRGGVPTPSAQATPKNGHAKRPPPPPGPPAAGGYQPAAHAYAPSAPAPQPEVDDTDDADDEDIEEELAFIAETFGDNLTSRQRREMKGFLSQDQLDAFDNMFCADTDEEVLEAYAHVAEIVPQEQLLQLAALLDEDQQLIYVKFNAQVKKALEGRAHEMSDGEADADEEEDDDDDDDDAHE